MMTTVGQILEQKGNKAMAVAPDNSILDALKIMAEFDIGAVLVTEDDQLVGIFTERDYARKVMLKGLVSHDVKVRELMTGNPFTVTPENTVKEVMQTMTDKRFRHLPVVSPSATWSSASLASTRRPSSTCRTTSLATSRPEKTRWKSAPRCRPVQGQSADYGCSPWRPCSKRRSRWRPVPTSHFPSCAPGSAPDREISLSRATDKRLVVASKGDLHEATDQYAHSRRHGLGEINSVL